MCEAREYTMGTMGARGVELAVLDGMQAAEKARENERQQVVIDGQQAQIDALNGQIRALNGQIRALRKAMTAKDQEIDALRKRCRDYRQILGVGYAKAIRMTKDDEKYRPLAIRNGVLWMTGGMILMILVIVLVLSAAVK